MQHSICLIFLTPSIPFLSFWERNGILNNRNPINCFVERELEIIGEATNRILKINPEVDISNSRRIVDLRNWVIHAYDNVDNAGKSLLTFGN